VTTNGHHLLYDHSAKADGHVVVTHGVLPMYLSLGNVWWRDKYYENSRKRSKTSQPFSTSIFEYENKSENDKAEHENEYELTEYQEF